MTTVGFGDVVPESTGGQVIAAILMVGGLSFFAVITGMITSIFVTRSQAAEGSPFEQSHARRLDEVVAELKAIRAELASLRDDRGP